MPRKDVLAAGQRTATFVGGVGDGENLKKVSDEPRFEFTPEPAIAQQRKKFRPAGFVMLIRQTEAKLGTGIIELAESVEKERPAEGMILNIGPKVTDFKIGDYVAFGKYAGQLFKLNGEDLLLAKEDEMLGTIEDETEINLDSGVDVGVCCSEFGINGGE